MPIGVWVRRERLRGRNTGLAEEVGSQSTPIQKIRCLSTFTNSNSSNSQVPTAMEMAWVVRVRNAETDQETNVSLRTGHS